VLRTPVSGITNTISALATATIEHLGVASFWPGVVEVSDGTFTNTVQAFVTSSSGTPGVYVNDAGVPYEQTAGVVISENTPAKIAVRANSSGCAISVDGSAVLTEPGDIPAGLDTITFGNGYNVAPLDGCVKDVYLWTRALTDAELQSVTT
jgi:hypothetical protein